MNKTRFTSIVILLLTCLLCHAYDCEVDGKYYNLNVREQTATLTNNGSYNSYSGTITIPETFTGPKGIDYDVVAIGENAFRGSTNLTGVTIASSIDTICANAFYGCTGLTKIKIPNTVMSIGSDAFYGCTKLSDVTLPKYITIISHDLFYNCTSLTDITIPTKVTTIESYAFAGCNKLATINFPTSIESIGDYAFNNCSSLDNITIPGSVKTIGKYSFLSCSQLSVISLSEGLNSISEGAFEYCTSLTSITLPKSLTNLGDATFYGDSKLATANLAANIKTLRTNLFNGCSSLTSVILPATLETMQSNAFYNCTLLSELTIPANVTTIASDALNSCSALKTITFAEGMKNILRAYNTYISNVIIPNSTEKIADNAFYNCSHLASVTLPSSVKELGAYSFYGCSSLTSIPLPVNLTTIGNYAFQNCTALTDITLPAKLTTIGTDAFANCNNLTTLVYEEGTKKALRTYATMLNQVTIPSTCAEIADNAFYNCSKLTRVNISHLEMWNYIFANRTSTPFCCAHTLYLNGQPLTDLLADFGTDVASYAFDNTLGLKNVTIMNSTKGIADNAFSNCPDLVSLVMGNGATYIGKNAFQGCTNMQSAKFGKSVKLIDNNAFYGCSKLQSVKTGGNEAIIGEKAFYGCSALERLTLPATVTTIGSAAFYGCKALTKINIPEGVSAINPQTFYQCIVLNDVTMPNALTSVGSYAFYDCDHLVNIEFGDKLTSIGDYCFNNCDSLRYIHFGTGIKTIGSYAFSNCKQLTDLYINAVTPPTTQSTTFSGSDVQYSSVYVPTEAISTYKTTSPWSTFGNWDGMSAAPTYVKSITVDPSVLVMEDDGGGTFKATVYPENATNKNLTWSSKNTAIAYVNKSGMVLAGGEEGITTVTCKAKDGNGAVANCLVIVNNDYKPLTTLTIDKDSMAMTEGDEETITATLLPDDATYPEVLWTSTDDNVATVSSTGVVTAVSKGNCTITATANDGSNLLAKCKIAVNEPKYASLALVGDVNSDGTLNEEDVNALSDLLLGNHGGIDIAAYDMDNNGVVNIADIVYVINCIKENKNKPAGNLKLIKLSASKYNMYTENKMQLIQTIIPYNASNSLAWSSSDSTIASVDSLGNVTAKIPGSVTITVKAKDDTGIADSCIINVETNPYGYADGYEWVDLGLPSGTRWATRNIGATKIEDYGNYYAWAETTTKENYDWSTYKFCEGSATTLTKYCTASAYGTKDKITKLITCDDAAYTTMSKSWCLPTMAQFKELLDSKNTMCEWTSQNGVMGYLITSRTNSHKVFFPAAGYMNGKTPTSVTTGCYYSTRETAATSNYNCIANMGSAGADTIATIYRCYGQTIRPVCSSYVQMSASQMKLKIDSTAVITATYISIDGATPEFTWSSSNPSVVTVEANGNIKAVGKGYAYIYATAKTGLVGMCKVTVGDDVIYYVSCLNSNNDKRYQFNYYFGKGYKMVIDMFMTSDRSYNDKNIIGGGGNSPIEFHSYNNGFYYDFHRPTSTTSNSCYNGDYSYRVMSTDISNYFLKDGTKMLVQLSEIETTIYNKDTNKQLYTKGYISDNYSWYSGLYTGNITPALGLFIHGIKVYDANGNLVNDLSFEKVEDDGKNMFSLYDKILNVYYESTDTLVPIYKESLSIQKPSDAKYAELDCLIGNGGYFVSDYTGASNVEVDVKFSYSSSTKSNYACLFGNYNGNTTGGRSATDFDFLYNKSTNGRFNHHQGLGENYLIDNTFSAGCIRQAIVNTNGMSLYDEDGGLLSTASISTAYNGSNAKWGIFCDTNSKSSPLTYTSNEGVFYGNIYYLKIYEGSTIVRNYVPAMRLSDSKVGLYDKVNDTFLEPYSGTFSYNNIVDYIGTKTEASTNVSSKDGHEYVDLGLPSGTLWSTCNIGASSPELPGNRYAWGEIESKSSFTQASYKYYNNGLYTSIGDDIANTDYDAATVAWGQSWAMPSLSQCQELIDNCSFSDDIINGYNVVIYTGRNGNTLIIPNNGTTGKGFWTSTIESSNYAYRMWEWSYISYSEREQGFPIRPICKN